MKNTRKLIPAIAMLLVSAVMMSTASFAWFTMNSEVKANGLEITAVAPASLWIKNDADAKYVSATTLVSENTAAPTDGLFKPVTVLTGGDATWNNWTFSELTSAASLRVDVDGNLANATEDDYVASTSYYKDKFVLKLESTPGDYAPISVDVKVTDPSEGSTDAIWRALRVAVVTANQALIFEFDTDPAADDDSDAGTLGTMAGAKTFTTPITAGDADTEVVVYAWYEGTDADCKNANALNTDTFKIDLVFNLGTLVKPDNTQQGN